VKFTIGGYTLTGWHAGLVVALGLLAFTLLQFWTWSSSSADARAFDQAPNCAAGPTALDCKLTVQVIVHPYLSSKTATTCTVYADQVKGGGSWVGSFQADECNRLRSGSTVGATIWRNRLDRISRILGTDLAVDDPVARNIGASQGILLAGAADAVAILLFVLNMAAKLLGSSRKTPAQPTLPLTPQEFARLGGAPKGSDLPPKLTLDGMPWAHLNHYARSTREGIPVLEIGKAFDHIGLIQALLDDVPGPIWIMYMLLLPHAFGPEAAGRYASDRPVPTDAVRDFLNSNYDFFEGDARHRLWFMSDPNRACSIVWDQRNRIFASGPLDEFEASCPNFDLTPGEIVVPEGLTPGIDARFDNDELHIASGAGLSWSWTQTPLQPADYD